MIEITLNMNPDILPTQKEWRLICAMVKQQRELTDEEIKEVYGKHFDVKNCDWLHLECIRAILKKANGKKHRKMSKQMEKDIQEIVDFYMQFVTGEHFSIRESLEYFWKCMNDYTIEDYLKTVRERKASKK